MSETFPGAISADEYRRMSADIEAERRELNRRHEDLMQRMLIGRRAPDSRGDVNELATAYYRAMAPGMHDKVVMTCRPDAPAEVTTTTRNNDTDIVIENVHNFALRARFVPRPGHGPSLSMAMRMIQDTGQYPTIQAHERGATPLFREEPGGPLSRLVIDRAVLPTVRAGDTLKIA